LDRRSHELPLHLDVDADADAGPAGRIATIMTAAKAAIQKRAREDKRNMYSSSFG
jgi:hypothetical protein